jgi:hypothetical protein
MQQIAAQPMPIFCVLRITIKSEHRRTKTECLAAHYKPSFFYLLLPPFLFLSSFLILLKCGSVLPLEAKSSFSSSFGFFLGAKKRLYKRLRRSVGSSVRPSVRPSVGRSVRWSVRPHDAIMWKTSYVAIASRRGGGKGKLVTSLLLRA